MNGMPNAVPARPRVHGRNNRLAVSGGILPDVFFTLGLVVHYGAIVTQSPCVEALATLLHHSALHTPTVCLDATSLVVCSYV